MSLINPKPKIKPSVSKEDNDIFQGFHTDIDQIQVCINVVIIEVVVIFEVKTALR